MSEEEELKNGSEINPDALEAVFAEEVILDDEEIPVTPFTDEDEDGVDEIDIAFQANDEGYW